MKPTLRPQSSMFSSGPCAKRPGWTLEALSGAAFGRSHRAKVSKEKLLSVIEKTRSVLRIPSDYKIGIIAGSATGAVEAAMWSVLGARGADLVCWESFSATWVDDAVRQLKLQDTRVFSAPYGEIPDLKQIDKTRDLLFAWNGTTSGVCVENGDFIADDRTGLTICDATSAAFAVALPWPKLDITAFSWQKGLGSEAAHGMIVLSPRAVERLETYSPPWPMPKLFRLVNSNGTLAEEIFEGITINTPSMLCVEDYLDALGWAEQIGGLDTLVSRCQENYKILRSWVEQSLWIDFLCHDKATRSPIGVCLNVSDPWALSLPKQVQADIPKKIVALLEKEGVAFDIGSYGSAPAGLRVWCGPTVESSDIEALLPWLDWAYNEIRKTLV